MPRSDQLVRAGERAEPALDSLGQLLGRGRRPGAQRHHPSDDGEQVFDPVTVARSVPHLSKPSIGRLSLLPVSLWSGATGVFGANHHLRQSLMFLDMPTL
jgi:hypothetical protein